jgi:hypothetical protein
VVRALCARLPGAFVQVERGSGNGQPDAFTVPCPDRSLALTGGVYMQRPGDGGEGVGNIATSWPSGVSGWAVGGTPTGPIGTRLVGFALCMPF